MLSVPPILQKQSAKILVVEGQDASRDLLSRILNSLAVEDICSMADYRNFKPHFLSFVPDLVILDATTPCGSIESIIEWVRLQALGKSVPIVVSAGSGYEGVNRALEQGANDYIQTPFVTAQVAARVKNLIQHLGLHSSETDAGLFDQRLQQGIKALQSEILHRNKIEQELHFQAYHEFHSRLPNRAFLQKVLVDLLISNNRYEELRSQTLVIFHLHQFNEINNTLGHSRADEILVEMALRFAKLSENHNEVITLQYGLYDQAGKVALLDRTHFTIVLNDIDESCLEDIIEQLLIDSSQPLNYQGMQIETPISVGFATVLDGEDLASWMRRAHVALEYSEQENQLWSGYCEQADRYSKKKLTLVADLRNAIATNQGLFLHYQPQFNCRNGKISGVEVLLRWDHPVHGSLPADEIVTLAEQTGLIQPLTRWVINHAFTQYQKVLSAGFQLTLSINLSTLNLWQEYLLEDIALQLEAYDIPAEQLILEVTETVLLKKPDLSLEFLHCLTALGTRIALDDFGTGFSSLAYLKKMPVSELKIDRSFVQELCHSHEDQVIVASTISMCKGLGIEVVAEGVEDRQTQLKLEALGCDRLQGYFLSKPLLGADLLLRLAKDGD